MTARLLRPLFALPFIVAFASPVHAETCDFYSSVLNGVDNAGFGAQQFSRNEWVVLRTPGIQPAFPPGATANPNEVVITAFVSELFQFDTVDDPNGLPVGGLELMTNSLYAHNVGEASLRAKLAQVSVSTFRNVNDLIIFQLDAQGALPASGAGGSGPQPNVAVFPGQGLAGLGGLGFLPGGVGSLTNFFGALSAGATLLQQEFLVPASGGGFIFFPTTDHSSIFGHVQFHAVDANADPNLQGDYAADFNGRFAASAQCR